MTIGEGTPASWDPAIKLVMAGAYHHVRKPMITSAFLVLLGEALLFGSWLIAIWISVSVIGNLLYLPLGEEQALEKRFGAAYLKYRMHEQRWIPRLKPWGQ